MENEKGLYTTGREDSFKRVYPSTTPASFDFKQSKNTDWFIEAKRRLEVRNEVEDNYNYAKIELESDRPVFIGLTGDWHLGGDCNYELLQRDIDVMVNNPLVDGVFFMGDLTDSANFNPAQNESILNYEEQSKMLKNILESIPEERIWALWRGNHDYKWEAKHGTSKYKQIAERYNKPVFYGASFIDLKINNIEYKILGSHQLRGSSIYNNSHPVLRAFREIEQLDIVVAGHTHRKGKIAQPIKGFNSARNGVGCITGTYQNASGYGKDRGFTKLQTEEQGMWWLMLDERRKSVEILSTEEMIQMAS